MRRALLLVALVAAVAVTGWSFATTRPAGMGATPVPAHSDVAATSAAGDISSTLTVSSGEAIEVDVPGEHALAPGRVQSHPSRPLVEGMVVVAVLLLLLGLAGRAAVARAPVLRHRLRRSVAPFSVAVLRAPPARATRLLPA